MHLSPREPAGWLCRALRTGCTLEGSSSSSLATTQPASSTAPGRLMYFTRPLSCTVRVMIIFITCCAERRPEMEPTRAGPCV